MNNVKEYLFSFVNFIRSQSNWPKVINSYYSFIGVKFKCSVYTRFRDLIAKNMYELKTIYFYTILDALFTQKINIGQPNVRIKCASTISSMYMRTIHVSCCFHRKNWFISVSARAFVGVLLLQRQCIRLHSIFLFKMNFLNLVTEIGPRQWQIKIDIFFNDSHFITL